MKKSNENIEECNRSEYGALQKARKNARPLASIRNTDEIVKRATGSDSSSSYYTDENKSEDEQDQELERTRYEARLANNQVRLNLFNSKGDDSSFINYNSV